MVMASVFAVPVTTTRHSEAPSRVTNTKRKRLSLESPTTQKDEDTLHDGRDEYSAILTPEERSQRRLAGHSLIKDFPPAPFPHKDPFRSEQLAPQIHETSHEKLSLRLQHLSAMTAVLHRSLMNKDYNRARRALGLILRTEVDGKPVDIRAAGNWAIGAEILLHQYANEPEYTNDVLRSQAQLRAGFGEAKQLYEMLIIQYPYNRSYPERINAVNFYLAMFNLWIYVVHMEHRNATQNEQTDSNTLYSDVIAQRRDAKTRELQEANDIAARMDTCLIAPPFNDNETLLRLRAMVAEWQADLNEESLNLVADIEGSIPSSSPPAQTLADGIHGLNLDDASGSRTRQLSQAASEARTRAANIYARIGQTDDSTR